MYGRETINAHMVLFGAEPGRLHHGVSPLLSLALRRGQRRRGYFFDRENRLVSLPNNPGLPCLTAGAADFLTGVAAEDFAGCAG